MARHAELSVRLGTGCCVGFLRHAPLLIPMACAHSCTPHTKPRLQLRRVVHVLQLHRLELLLQLLDLRHQALHLLLRTYRL